MHRRWRIEEGPPDPRDVLQDRKALDVHRTVVRVRHRRNYGAPGVFDEHRRLLSGAIPAGLTWWKSCATGAFGFFLSVGVGAKRGLWDPEWDPKNSGYLAGTERMGEELWLPDVR